MGDTSGNSLVNITDSDAMSNISLSLDNSTVTFLNQTSIILPSAFLAGIYTMRVLWSILAIAGNGLTIYAIIKFSSLQSTTNCLVASLAVADFIQGLLTPAVILHHVLKDQPSFVQICLAEKTLSGISLRANFINILWISLDRFFYIAYPLRYPLWQTPQKALILIALTWAYVTIDTPLVIYLTSILKPGGICKLSLIFRRDIYSFYFVPQMFICIVITILCYIAIAKIAYKQGKAIAALHHPFETLEASIHQKQKKIAKMMFTVLASYLMCYLPQYCLTIVIQRKKTLLTIAMEKVTTLIYYTNSFINPLIYGWRSKEFNSAFRKILGIKNEVAPSTSNGTAGAS